MSKEANQSKRRYFPLRDASNPYKVMSKMSDMAMTIEELRSAAAAINEAANWLAEQFGGTVDEASAKEPAANRYWRMW